MTFKATHQYVQTGVKNAQLKVSFTVTGDEIIKCISHMLYMGKKVNSGSVLEQLKHLFWYDGSQWYQTDNYNYPEHIQEATQLAHKYFPSFF